MTNKKPILEHQKQRLELAIDEISTPIFSTEPVLIKDGFFILCELGLAIGMARALCSLKGMIGSFL